MHRRCSDRSLYRRFHAPLTHLSPRMVRRLVAPPSGWSILAEGPEGVIGLACAAPVSDCQVEVGLLVEDRRQRQGVGTRLLHAVATDTAARGFRSLQCLTQPDNHAVLKTVQRAALLGRVSGCDGLLVVTMPVRQLAVEPLPWNAPCTA